MVVVSKDRIWRVDSKPLAMGICGGVSFTETTRVCAWRENWELGIRNREEDK